MIIVQGEDPRGWTGLPNALLEDGTLTFSARGVLGYLLSRPPEWQTDARRLARSKHAGLNGRDSVLSALDELVRAGYVVRVKSQGEGGRWTTRAYVYREPVPLEQRSPSGRRPRVDKPVDTPVEGL